MGNIIVACFLLTHSVVLLQNAVTTGLGLATAGALVRRRGLQLSAVVVQRQSHGFLEHVANSVDRLR